MSHRTSVFRETPDGNFTQVPILESERFPSVPEVLAGLRSFCDKAEDGDFVLLRPEQARILVELADELALTLRKSAQRLDGRRNL